MRVKNIGPDYKKRCVVCGVYKLRSENFYSCVLKNGPEAGHKKYGGRCKECQLEYANGKGIQGIMGLPVAKRRKLWNEASKRSRIKHTDHYESRAITNTAIRKGVIKRLPCEVCGEEKSQAHHPDYSKPLEIKWLCHLRHRAIHYPHAYKHLINNPTEK